MTDLAGCYIQGNTVMHFRFGQSTYQFHFRLGFFFLTLLFFIILCSLGTWQLYRYHFKKELLNNYETRIHSLPKPFLSIASSDKDWQFQPISVEGQFDNTQTMLIQNQLYEGREGYEVLTPMRLIGEKKLLLVDRGWLAKEQLNSLPKANTELMTLTGYIKSVNDPQFMLGKNIYSTQFPLVMQKINFSEIEAITGKTFFPFIVRMTSSDKDGLIRDWVVTSIMPAKHLGYSIQWFLMAAVLMIAYFCFCCESIKNDR